MLAKLEGTECVSCEKVRMLYYWVETYSAVNKVVILNWWILVSDNGFHTSLKKTDKKFYNCHSFKSSLLITHRKWNSVALIPNVRNNYILRIQFFPDTGTICDWRKRCQWIMRLSGYRYLTGKVNLNLKLNCAENKNDKVLFNNCMLYLELFVLQPVVLYRKLQR
jgi:hypothetical protein